MLDLVVLFRAKQLIVHNMHNLSSRVAFLSDHEYLGELYAKAEDQYDSVVERMIGLGMPIDLISVQIQAAQKLPTLSVAKDNSEMFSQIISLNRQILQVIEIKCKSGQLSQGTLQLLGGHADELEAELYKLTQRTKK